MQARQPDFVFPAADSLATQQARGGAMAWQTQYDEIKKQEATSALKSFINGKTMFYHATKPT